MVLGLSLFWSLHRALGFRPAPCGGASREHWLGLKPGFIRVMLRQGGPQTVNFADSLIERVRELGHPLCVGLDPHLERIPAAFRQGSMRPSDPATVR